jgi:hypothetical protein
VEIRNAAGDTCSEILAGEPFEIVVALRNPLDNDFVAVIGVEILDSEGVSLFTSHSNDVLCNMTQLPAGISTATCVVQKNPLMPGAYSMQLGLVDRQWLLIDFARPELGLHVRDVPYLGFNLHLRRPGRLLFGLPWKFGRI